MGKYEHWENFDNFWDRSFPVDNVRYGIERNKSTEGENYDAPTETGMLIYLATKVTIK